MNVREEREMKMPKNPLENLPEVPSFEVEATDINPDGTFTEVHYSEKMGIEGGKDQSPALRFSNIPEGTKSLVVEIYDPDAPTAGGYWHWTVIDIPGDVKGLGADAGNPDGKKLPGKALNMPNDAGYSGYIGSAPPEGETHRYFVIVSALDTEKLDVAKDTTPNVVNFELNDHIIGRAVTIIKGSN